MLSCVKLIAGAVALVVGLSAVGVARADDVHDQADRLAVRLQGQVRVLHKEAHTHFRSLPRYPSLDRDLVEMDRLAAHVHDLVHRHANVSHLRADVHKLDDLAHRAMELVDDLARYGRLSNSTYQQLRQVLSQVDQTVHHLAELTE